MKRTPLKKVSNRRAAVVKADRELYARVWAARPHVCDECDLNLGNFPNPTFFSHILTKAAHPALRHVDANIQLLCFKHHHQYEFGDRRAMKTAQKILDLIENLYELEQALKK